MSTTTEREDDARLAVEVLGWTDVARDDHGYFEGMPPGSMLLKGKPLPYVPHFGTDEAAMVALWNGMLAKGWWYTLECDEDDAAAPHYATFCKSGQCHNGRGSTPMAAVKMAALAAIA